MPHVAVSCLLTTHGWVFGWASGYGYPTTLSTQMYVYSTQECSAEALLQDVESWSNRKLIYVVKQSRHAYLLVIFSLLLAFWYLPHPLCLSIFSTCYLHFFGPNIFQTQTFFKPKIYFRPKVFFDLNFLHPILSFFFYFSSIMESCSWKAVAKVQLQKEILSKGFWMICLNWFCFCQTQLQLQLNLSWMLR